MYNEINKTSINGIIPTLLVVILVFGAFLATDIKQCENQETIIENQQTIISEISEIKTKNESINNTNEPDLETPVAKTCLVEIAKQEIQLEIPDCDTSFKAFMDYNCITDTTTKQYELQQQAYTDEYGLRKIDEYYCVALGSYYTETIGDKFKITLDTDVEFNVIVGDLKQDCHTDVKNQYTPVYDNSGNFYGANIIEFIIDENAIHDMVYVFGTISYYDKFQGNIISIEKIEIINN